MGYGENTRAIYAYLRHADNQPATTREIVPAVLKAGVATLINQKLRTSLATLGYVFARWPNKSR